MKLIKNLLLAASLLAFSAFSARAITLTEFSSADFTVTSYDFTTVEAGADSIHIVGTDEGNGVYGTLTTPISLSQSYDYLLLTGYYTGTSNTRFDIQLFDEEGNLLSYTGFFSEFNQGAQTTVRLNFDYADGVFNGPVIMVGLISTGLGASVNLTVDRLTAEAIPEPSTWALMLTAAGGLAFYMRRRQVA